MTNRVKPAAENSFIASNSEMSVLAKISIDALTKMRARNIFVQGTHWFLMPGTNRVLWHKDLSLDLIVNGENSEKHRLAIENFQNSLPSSLNYKLAKV